jgi:hypothetical protein
MNLSRSFVIRDTQGVIYTGQFVSPVSSQSYPGPIIQTGLAEVEPPLYAIQRTYPAGLAGGEDGRFNPRLRQALEKGGALQTIRRDEKGEPIQHPSTDWQGDSDILRIRADLFPETFQLGQTARVHLFFASGQSRSAFDIVQVESTLSQENGFFCTVDHTISDKVTADNIKEGVYVIRWKPWGPVYGAREYTAKAGPAKLSLIVILRKSAPVGGQMTVYSVKLPAQTLAILPALPPSPAVGKGN